MTHLKDISTNTHTTISALQSFLIESMNKYYFVLFGTDRVFRNVCIYNSYAGELPKRKQTTFRTLRKFEIMYHFKHVGLALLTAENTKIEDETPSGVVAYQGGVHPHPLPEIPKISVESTIA